MKEEGLLWGDKCFNVDSFQGISIFLYYSYLLLTPEHQEMKMTTSLSLLSEPEE